ncbi:MAG: CsbD family protein [Caulobacteraceae bacterium]
MDENRIEGAVKQGIGHAQDALGGGTGDAGLQARGKWNQVEGSAQNLYGKAMDQVRDLAKELSEQARDLAEQGRALADQAKDKISDQPYAAVGIAAVAGLVLGMLLSGGRGSKVVYLRRE